MSKNHLFSIHKKITKITCLSVGHDLKKKKKKSNLKTIEAGAHNICKHANTPHKILKSRNKLFHLYFRLKYFTTEIETVFPCATAAQKSVLRQYKPEVEVT